jgi:hypothetical protein
MKRTHADLAIKYFMDERGKVLKGPKFFPPEPKIAELLRKLRGDEHEL